MQVRSKRLIRIVGIVAASIVGLLLLGVVLDQLTASPQVCGSCHEMAPAVDAWRESAHAQVGCPECHEKPRPWYQLPQRLASRSAMLGADYALHFSKRAGLDASRESSETTVSVPDSTCLECHDESRQVTNRLGTLIDHREHAKRNGSCVSCHLWTAHPPPGEEKPLLMMKQCFACHGRTPGAKAPGDCDVCHSPSFSLRPESHRTAKWKRQHGEAALAKKQPCQICHDQEYCDSCHGLEMPHPAGWEKGSPPDHSRNAKLNRTTCTNCHTEKPDFCSMCHHKGWKPATGPWVEQHPELVEQRGAAYCFDCHGPDYCVKCHTKQVTGADEAEE